jgi:hypothetical protein
MAEPNVRQLPDPTASLTEPATNRRANPLLISSRSEYLGLPNAGALSRPDQPVIVNEPGTYYGVESDAQPGNTVSTDQMSAMATRNRVGKPSRTSPSGTDESFGW